MNPNTIGPIGPTPRGAQTVTVERTYLSMPSLEQLVPRAAQVPAQLVWLPNCTVEEWRSLYRQIGAEWHWHDRDVWDQGRIHDHLRNADVRVYHVMCEAVPHPERPAGFLELTRHQDGSVEIVYLGLDRSAFGLGLGGWLVSEAVRTGFAWGGTRVWLHTCTLDSPAALPNYLARGFVVEKSETYQTVLSS